MDTTRSLVCNYCLNGRGDTRWQRLPDQSGGLGNLVWQPPDWRPACRSGQIKAGQRRGGRLSDGMSQLYKNTAGKGSRFVRCPLLKGELSLKHGNIQMEATLTKVTATPIFFLWEIFFYTFFLENWNHCRRPLKTLKPVVQYNTIQCNFQYNTIFQWDQLCNSWMVQLVKCVLNKYRVSTWMHI